MNIPVLIGGVTIAVVVVTMVLVVVILLFYTRERRRGGMQSMDANGHFMQFLIKALSHT